MKDRKFKAQRGAISLFVMSTMLFFLVTVVGIYTIFSKRAQTQTESFKSVQSQYYEEGKEITEYDSKIASSSEKIPIYTKEHFWSIGENSAVEIDGKVYDFSSTTYSNYELKNDIVINIETDLANSKFKDNLYYGGQITTNGYEVYYYYEGKYYEPVTYSDGTNSYSLTSGEADLSASGTDFATISTSTRNLSGTYYTFGTK